MNNFKFINHLNHNSTVVKHNFLLPQLAKMKLSELRLLSFCLAHYDSRPIAKDQTNIEFSTSIKEMLNIFPNINKQIAYTVVKNAIKGINSKPYEDVIINADGKKVKRLFNWFYSIEYICNEGQFTFTISKDISNLLLNLKGSFTKYSLQDVYLFRSSLSWKLYEHFKQWFSKGYWEINLDELKSLLGISGKYTDWTNFKNRVLIKQLKEINELSNIFVSYEVKKKVRSIVGIIFFIKSKEEVLQDNDPRIVRTIGDTNNDIRLLMSVGLTKRQAINLSALAKEANKDLKVIFEQVLNNYKRKPQEERGKLPAYIYKGLYNEFTPKLFDLPINNLDFKTIFPELEINLSMNNANLRMTKQIEENQRKQTEKNNALSKRAINCKYFENSCEQNECSFENLESEVCMICKKFIKSEP